jgi:hypothetical protein
VKSTRLRARCIGAGYGGVGPQSFAPQPDLWIVLLIGIEASEERSGLAFGQLELLDAAGNVVARATPPFSLRRDTTDDEARRKLDFAEHGTIPFDGELVPDRELRLRVHAPLDTRSESLEHVAVRFRVRFFAAHDPGSWLEGPLDGPGPTAGPQPL